MSPILRTWPHWPKQCSSQVHWRMARLRPWEKKSDLRRLLAGEESKWNKWEQSYWLAWYFYSSATAASWWRRTTHRLIATAANAAFEERRESTHSILLRMSCSSTKEGTGSRQYHRDDNYWDIPKQRKSSSKEKLRIRLRLRRRIVLGEMIMRCSIRLGWSSRPPRPASQETFIIKARDATTTTMTKQLLILLPITLLCYNALNYFLLYNCLLFFNI